MASAETLLMQIAAGIRGGKYDDRIDDIGGGVTMMARALKDRRRELAAREVASLKSGDLVRISGLKESSRLNGVIATVVELKRTRALVRVPVDAPRYAGRTVTIPGSCLTAMTPADAD